MTSPAKPAPLNVLHHLNRAACIARPWAFSFAGHVQNRGAVSARPTSSKTRSKPDFSSEKSLVSIATSPAVSCVHGGPGAIFIARHGSWNKSQKIGGDVMVVTLNPDGTVKSVETFITGFIQNNNYIGRPADIEWMKDGSMLLSDDYNGAVYRISYGPAYSATR
jgi:glucose/arabinose dehydrogenase